MSFRAALSLGVSFVLLSAAGALSTPRGPAQEGSRRLTAGDVPAAAQAAPVAIPDAWYGPGPLHKVWIEKDELGPRTRLAATGAVIRWYEYGAFAVAVVDERLLAGDLRGLGLRVRDELDLMVFNEIVLDGRRPQETLARLDPSERFTAPDATALDPLAGLYVVQFEGPVRDEWVAELEGIGIDFRQYVPMNAYVVGVPDEKVGLLDSMKTLPYVQYVGAYEPAFRMHARLRQMVRTGEENQPQRVTIQLANRAGAREALEQIRGVAEDVESVTNVGPYVNVRARVHPVYFQSLAADPAVFQVEPLGQPERMDERQGQIMAGNTGASGPSAPGYLAWLASHGFGSAQFGSFAVNVADDATSLTGHPDLPSSRVAFTLNPTGQTGSQGGHGFLNANIVAGFNDLAGSAYEDSGGYNYGLGIAPWARVGSTAIFGPGGLNPTGYESQAYGLGARISTNSWGFVDAFQNPIADYDANSQEFDFITRDAQGGTGGNQEYMVVFSAGNGGGTNTVGTPGTAKNVLTVGASENDRQTGTDGCGVPNSGANNYNDLASFSSRGPVNGSGGDGRWKPEIVAPGTHIQAGVPQSNYGGTSVCNAYWPTGQTLYGWSSGTSHSTPALAGAAALVRQYFLNQSQPAPSPAMTKAYLVNTGEYMTGALANDTLPSNAQGMGNVHLGRAFDGTPRILVDQTQLLTSTGQSYSTGGSVADGGQPFRVTLVWTDAPGPTSGAPYVNDLDLTVTVNGSTYRGNVFAGANSTTGGAADFRNNTESVFLPAGTTGSFTVTVDAASIGGDGVPGNGDTTDQDFALVVYNGTSGPVGPTAQFSGNPTSGIVPVTVDFTDLSTAGVTSWSWDFGDGGTSTAQNPSHTYTSTGSYTVTLTVTDPIGSDSEVKTDYVSVISPPTPGIADGSFESQTAGSAPTSPWTIDFGTGHVIDPAGGTSADGGLPTDGVNWLEISAASTNGATGPSNPGGFGSPPSGGAGVSQSFFYDTGVTLLSFDAAFLRNEAANTTYNDWMSVDVTDGVSWYNLYYADTFTPTTQTSSKYGYAMTAVSHVSADLATLFPSSTPATSFTVTVLVGNGVDGIQPSIGYADDFRLSGTGPVPPTAGFTGSPTSGVVPLVVGFTDSSTGDVTGWSWTFGDGGTSTLQNPSHTYNAVGTYTVSLTVSGPGGSDTLTRASYITVSEPPPVASFTGSPTSGTAPLSVSFTDASTGTITSRSWTFGDGGTSTLQNPSHTYNAAGTYTVSLTVTGPGGSDTQTRTNYVTVSEPPPVAGFSGSPTSGVAPLSVGFTDSSSGAVTSWSWTFGDGGTSTQQNPGHTYTTPGVYTVALTVTGPGGSDTLTRIDYVSVAEPPPVADFTGSPTSGVVPLSVSFADASAGNVTSWSWTFGDGGTSTAQNPSHTYNAVGVYTVSLTVSGPGGSDSLTRVDYVDVQDPTPVAGFTGTPTTGTAPLSVDFTDASSGNVTGWSWTFGDGGTSTAQNPSHTYAAAGTYTVSLTASGPGGSDTLTRLDYIVVSDPAPVASFTGAPTSGTAPLAVSFTDASSGPITGWSWTFGDGGTSTLQNPSHTYSAPGTYTVSLTVSGPGGSDTQTRAGYITVNPPPPVASFTASPTSGTAPLAVGFTDTSTGVIDTWSWTFGDGGTSSAQNPSHTYTSAGTYSVSLTVTGPGGSSASTQTDLITVAPPASAPVYYLSFNTNTAVPGVGTVTDDDIVAYDTGTGTWSFYFDGSDVGLGSTDIDALHVRADGSILMSFNTSYTVPGLGTVDDSDIVLFTPTSLGTSTSGSFALYFDGSDVGLSSNGEDVDGIYEFADGSLGISTLGGVSANGVTGADEDVIRFTGTFGPNTSGSFVMYFDGSDVGFNSSGSYDLDAVSFDAAGALLFSTVGTYAAAGGSGDDEDVSRFSGSFGPSTSGSAALLLDLSSLGISTGEDVDGLSFQP